MGCSPFTRALIRGLLAGAVVFTGTACSRPDRAESGSNDGATVLPDSSTDVMQPSDTGPAAGAVSDTAAEPAESSIQPGTPAQPSTPRAETATPSDTGAGYRPMEPDTAAPSRDLDSARVTADTAEVSQATDTAAVEMARDTSPVADQADTSTTPNGDVALQANVDTTTQADTAISAAVSAETSVAVAETSVAVAEGTDASTADTTDNGGRIRPPEDSTEILGQVDTTDVVRVRPPEDSTEILGNATTTYDAADETADEQIINPTDEIGAAAVAGDVTGSEAVVLLSRQGARCAVVDPEENEAVRWDMSSTPVALNPCGLGSMVLSRIRTEQ